MEFLGAMKMNRWVVVPLMLLLAASLHAQTAPKRTLVFISDTHMGIGKNAKGEWQPSEDFRWGHALNGFLGHVETTYATPVDLLILGDVLELWQPFPGMPCTAPIAETSCTVGETAALATFVANAHEADLRRIGDFSKKGDNRVYLVSGNHDAALNLDEVWNKVLPSFGPDARVQLVKSGVWVSPRGLTVAEHGHQIGKDVNKFDQWPKVNNDRYPDHLARPWGQLFVQKIFNDFENVYPLIDNISPESVGAKYLIADQGVAATAKDVGRFVLFNLFETSRSQLSDLLSLDENNLPAWSVALGRAAGYRLVVASLPDGDSFAALIASDSDAGVSLRGALDEQVRALPDEGVKQLCDLAAMLKKYPCTADLASNTVESLLRSERQIVTPHLKMRQETHRKMVNFIYGHTHEYQVPWKAVFDGSSVTVANTGAFQRVVDETGFELRRHKDKDKDKKLSYFESLRGITLDNLAACYTFVVIEDEGMPSKLWRWYQPEDAAQGTRESAASTKCE
jgi:UDP-2,3-diacylglucosamine pyrophosphatase LpxH